MKEYNAILVCIPHHTNMTSAPTVSTPSSTGDHWTPRRTSNYNYDELGPSDEPRKRPSRPTSRFSTHIVPKYETLFSPRLRDPFTRTPNLDFLFYFYFICVCVCGRRLNALPCCIGFLFYFYRWPVWFLANLSIDIALHDTF